MSDVSKTSVIKDNIRKYVCGEDNTSSMTGQQVFDKVVNHLRKQGHKAMSSQHEDSMRNGVPICAYLDPATGDRCAAGCLIESDEYRTTYESERFFMILTNPIYGAPRSLVDRLYPHRSLIGSLHDVHDIKEPENWEETLESVADQYGLTYTPPTPQEEHGQETGG